MSYKMTKHRENIPMSSDNYLTFLSIIIFYWKNCWIDCWKKVEKIFNQLSNTGWK